MIKKFTNYKGGAKAQIFTEQGLAILDFKKGKAVMKVQYSYPYFTLSG